MISKNYIILIAGIGGLAALYLLKSKSKIAVTTRKGVISMANKLSAYGAELIKSLESLSLKVYPDAGGYSIGYGHYLGKSPTIKTISKDLAEKYFLEDVANVEAEMKRYITAPLNQNQHDALVSFFYNLGHKGFVNADGSKTQILQKLNNKDYLGAANQFDRWIYSQGVENSALKNRRSAEKALFTK